MCKQMMLCLVALAFFASSYAQITNPGACPDYPVHMDFDVPAYLGQWYEVQRYDQIFQRNGDCITATYNLRDDGTVQVINSMAILPNVTQGPQFGSAVVSFPDRVPLPGKLNVTFSDTLEPQRYNYFILDTDYTQFAVVWSCQAIGSLRRAEFAWILSRTQVLSADAQLRVDTAIDSFLDRSSLRTTELSPEQCQWSEEETLNTYEYTNV